MQIVLALFLVLFTACLATAPEDDDPPMARVIVQWDPLACWSPHRVVLELEHDDGSMAASSAPCALGSLTVDLDRWGIYHGRFYGWELGRPIRDVARVTLTVDAPVIRWQLAEPP